MNPLEDFIRFGPPPEAVDRDAIERTLAAARQKLLDARVAAGYWEGELSSSALSTATALHALAAAHASIGALKDSMLDFVDTLWTGKGFCGSWADDVVDSEYTYYGLLALGHLSLS